MNVLKEAVRLYLELRELDQYVETRHLFVPSQGSKESVGRLLQEHEGLKGCCLEIMKNEANKSDFDEYSEEIYELTYKIINSEAVEYMKSKDIHLEEGEKILLEPVFHVLAQEIAILKAVLNEIDVNMSGFDERIRGEFEHIYNEMKGLKCKKK